MALFSKKPSIQRMANRISTIKNGVTVNDNIFTFLKNICWSFTGTLVASGTMLLINIIAGRILGPDGFGRYGLVLTFSQLIIMIIFFGIDTASIRTIAQAKTITEQKQHISTALLFVCITSSFFVIIAYFLEPYTKSFFKLDNNFIFLLLLFSIPLAIKMLLDGFSRALGTFRKQFFARIFETIGVSMLFVIFIALKHFNNYQHYIYVLAFGSIIAIAIFMFQLRNYAARPSFKSLNTQLSYGKILLIGTVLGATFNSLDKLFIGKYLSIAELGIYYAYFGTSTNLVAQISQTITNVFFPTVSRLPLNQEHVNKILFSFLLLSVPFIIFYSATIFIIITLFGSQFRPSIYMALAFGVLATLQTIFTLQASLITAISKKLYKKYLIISNVVYVFSLFGYFVLIKTYFTISSVILFISTYMIVLIFSQYFLIKKFNDAA